MNFPVFRWLIPIASALAGWAVGNWMGVADAFSEPTAKKASAEKSATKAASAPARPSGVSSAAATAPGETPTADEAMREGALRVLFAAGDAKKTLVAFLDYARQNPARALDLAMSFDGEQGWKLPMNLLLELPAAHGTLAVEVLKRHPKYLKACPVMDAAFCLCAKLDPERAWAEAHAPGVMFTRDALRAIARGCADSQPAKGAELALRIDDSKQRGEFARTIFRGWIKADQSGMLAWLKTRPELAHEVPWGSLSFRRVEDFLAMAEGMPLAVLDGIDYRFGLAKKDGGGWPLRRDWISAVKDEKRRAALYAGAAHALMEVDPELALPLAAEVSDPRLRNRITSLVAAYRAAASPQEGLAFAESLTDQTARSLARRSALATWSKNDPAAAGSYLLEHGLHEPSGTVNSLLNEWTRVAPEAAAQAVLRRVEDGAAPSDAMLSAVMGRWVMDDAYAASKWVSALPEGPHRDSAVVALVTHSARREPEAALGWAQTVSQPQQRLSAMENTLSTWLRADRASALHWLQTSPLDVATRTALDQVAASVAVEAPGSSSGWSSSGGIIVLY